VEDEVPLRPASGSTGDAASQLASESLDRYSQEDLAARVALLEAEIARVKAHGAAAAAHRLAAEAFFKQSGPGTGSEPS